MDKLWISRRIRQNGIRRVLAAGLALLLVFSAPAPAVTIEARAYSVGDDYPEKYKVAARRSLIDEWRFYNRECVSFAAHCLNTRNGIPFTNFYGGVQWSNAKNWGTVAASLGYAVDMNPAVGSIYWTEGPYAGGHVAWVAEVDGDTVVIEEYNNNGDGAFHRKTIDKSKADGYIHLADITAENPGLWPADGASGDGNSADNASAAADDNSGSELTGSGASSGAGENVFDDADNVSVGDAGKVENILGNDDSGSDSAKRSGDNGSGALQNRMDEKYEICFSDVSDADWFREDVIYCAEKGLISGTGEGRFSPNEAATRAAVITVLYRMAGEPEVASREAENPSSGAAVETSEIAGSSGISAESAGNTSSSSATMENTENNVFIDVPAGIWYEDAALWAAAEGIASGTGNGRFSPETAVTREQLATLIFRFAGAGGADGAKEAGIGDNEIHDAAWLSDRSAGGDGTSDSVGATEASGLSAFSDADEIDDYARRAFSWAVSAGLFSGDSAGRLRPKDGASRAELAAVLRRLSNEAL